MKCLGLGLDVLQELDKAPIQLIHASNFYRRPHAVLQWRIPCGPKSIFPIDQHCKRDVWATLRLNQALRRLVQGCGRTQLEEYHCRSLNSAWIASIFNSWLSSKNFSTEAFLLCNKLTEYFSSPAGSGSTMLFGASSNIKETQSKS